jgi:hypothetical protein
MKLVIEFLLGSTILIPSVTLRHSNVRLQEGEARVSFTQNTPGGLFWWVENSFRTIADFEKQDKNVIGARRASWRIISSESMESCLTLRFFLFS